MMRVLRKLFRRVLRVLLWLNLFWLLFILALMVVIYVYGSIDRAQTADVIIILGAGVNVDGSPGWALERRAGQAAELWKDGYAAYILCTGSQAYQRPRSEAEACREVLIQNGIPPEIIFMETRSRSTQENAVYAHEVMRQNGWQTALVVTDSYHLLRSHLIFEREGIAFSESPVPASQVYDILFYLYSLLREVVALHWLMFVWLLNLPVTYVALV